MTRDRWALASDRGQATIMVALMAVVLMAFAGLAVDVGRLFVVRAQLSRAVDVAALAGILELPNQANAATKVRDYMAANEPAATVTVTSDPTNNQITVSASEKVRTYLVALVGIPQATVSERAVAGMGVLPTDVYMAVDATGSMGYDAQGQTCTSKPTCPINMAKTAAQQFSNTLLTGSNSGDTVVGMGPFRGCYNPPRNYSACVSGSSVVSLTSHLSTVTAGITGVQSVGGTGTNVCLALLKGQQVLFGAGSHGASNTHRYAVILSDGDNVYETNAYNLAQNSPDPSCRPSNATTQDSDTSIGCSNIAGRSHKNDMDNQAYAMASNLKAQNVEVYVVGDGVCGSANSNLCATSMIGKSSYDDTTRDRNLLKCIASSHSGTNDHYFEDTDPSQLPSIFTNIAHQISERLLQ